MAFISGVELVSLLPRDTTVSISEAIRFIESAKSRLAESHAPDALPDTFLTEDLVEQMAYARALERHYLKGEAAIEVPAAKDAIDRAEAAFVAYDARHETEGEIEIEAPLAIVEEAPF